MIIKKLLFKNRCKICNEKLKWNKYSICSNCYKQIKGRRRLRLLGNNIYYLWNYIGPIKKLITRYKLDNQKKVSLIFSNLIDQNLKDIIKKENIDYIIPVPISKKRKRNRGFDQLEEILKKIGIKTIKIRRKKETKHMYDLKTYDKRRENIKNSFVIGKKIDLDGKNILIFDDIITTGSTVNEIKKEILKQYNPNRFIIFVIAAAKTYKRRSGKI
ncbi:MAG: ComF family protein [Fusobacteriota bacterium]